jgi:hypothetical protein
LYTPPVVVSDDGAIQMIGLEASCLWEVHRYFFNRGSKSRNKVAVGEPAAGSFFRNDFKKTFSPSFLLSPLLFFLEGGKGKNTTNNKKRSFSLLS